MSSDPIEVLRALRDEWARVEGVGPAIDAALASMPAPKPESAEAVAWVRWHRQHGFRWRPIEYEARPEDRHGYVSVPLYTAPPRPEATWKVLEIGARGSAYDPPNTRRAFTYEHQPGNVLASSLGSATKTAANASAGDSIDRGLGLLKALQEEGFGVFQIEPSTAAPPRPEASDDGFNGDNAKLVSSIHALLSLDAAGALVPHGIGGHARSLLAAAANRLAPQQASAPVGVEGRAREARVALDNAIVLAQQPASTSRQPESDGYRQFFEAAMRTAKDAMHYVQTHADQFDARPGDDKLAIVCREFLKAQQPAAVGGESVIIDGRRYDLDTVRTALLGLAADVTRDAAQQPAAVDDTARLDFIERTFSGMTNQERYLPVRMIWGRGANGRSLREACDKYMAREASHQQGGDQ